MSRIITSAGAGEGPAPDPRHIIAADAPLRKAFEMLNALSGGNMTLFAVDASGHLAGSLTDGDLRRAVIAGLPLDAPVDRASHKECLALPPGADRYEVIRRARRLGISMLPATDREGRVASLIDLRRVRNALPIDAVLMAGGRGERLRPLTDTGPKPLLEVGGKAIIDYNVDELLANGVRHIYVTVNYLHEQIERHFADPRFEGRVSCVLEPRRLGTMGSLSLIPGLTEETVLVMNSDLLTTLDFEKMFLAHAAAGAELTMAAVPYTVSVPFAIIEAEGRRITGLTEKPTYNYFAYAGVYMMRREVARSIPAGEYLDAPDLVDSLIRRGRRVDYFPVEGTWVDIGSPDDFRYANELMTAGARRR